jgi:hypothetical protein
MNAPFSLSLPLFSLYVLFAIVALVYRLMKARSALRPIEDSSTPLRLPLPAPWLCLLWRGAAAVAQLPRKLLPSLNKP